MNIQKVTIVAPTPMPFTIKEELNFDALYKNTELWLKTKLDGFVIGTANGEEAYVTQEEKYQATKIISEASNNSKLIIGGIDNPSIYGTLSQIEKFHDSGANHVRIRIPRSGNTVNYFEKISTESSLPVIVIHQNIGGSENSIKPKSNLAEPEEIGEICSMDNIVGYITDHSVRFEAIVRNHVPKNKYFWICNGSLIIHGVLIGANGACMAFGNIGSAAAHKIFEYIKLNQFQDALDLQKKVTKIDYFVMKTGRGCLKAALEILGFELGLPRKPQPSLDKKNLLLLEKELESVKPHLF